MSVNPYFRVEKTQDVALLIFDRPDKEMNVLSEVVLREFADHIDTLGNDASVQAVILMSGKKDQFIVGADISEIEKLTDVETARNSATALQSVFQKVADLKKPVVAAIHGTTMGGGCELSLACHRRICTDSKKTSIGLPEIKLGLIPGAGGTQRLPRLVGIQTALDLILTGKQIDGQKALKIGLVDACVPEGSLLTEAIKLAQQKKTSERKETFTEKLTHTLLEDNSIGRLVMYRKAKDTVTEKTKGFYPASYKALEAVFGGISMSLKHGLELEAKLFGELAATRESQSLIHLFHATNAIKKHPYKGADDDRFGGKKVEHVGLVGAGFMGAGITNVCVERGLRVSLSDPSKESIGKLLLSVKKFLDKKVERRRLKKFEASSKLAQISPGESPAGFEKTDMIIEAVFEDLSLKQKILADLEKSAGENFIFATNTSAIPITDIAAHAKMPERVVGVHFFSPVEKMPLLEVIVTKKTAPWVAARAIQFGQAIGKQVIVVNDGPGFYTVRALAFYMAEAAKILAEGQAIDVIDKAMTDFGFPVGPLTLTDEVGIDVGIHVLETIAKAYPDRMQLPEGFDAVVKSGRLGRKNLKGFYHYENGKKTVADVEIYSLSGITIQNALSANDVIDRCLLVFINESVRCLEDGILPTAYEGDVGAVFGLGFPPFLGGPFKFVDHQGARVVVEKLLALETKHGARFKPAKMLVDYAAKNQKFFPNESAK